MVPARSETGGLWSFFEWHHRARWREIDGIGDNHTHCTGHSSSWVYLCKLHFHLCKTHLTTFTVECAVNCFIKLLCCLTHKNADDSPELAKELSRRLWEKMLDHKFWLKKWWNNKLAIGGLQCKKATWVIFSSALHKWPPNGNWH